MHRIGILAGVTLISAFLVIYPTTPENLPAPPTNLKNRFKKKKSEATINGAVDAEALAAQEVPELCPNVVFTNDARHSCALTPYINELYFLLFHALIDFSASYLKPLFNLLSSNSTTDVLTLTGGKEKVRQLPLRG